MLEEFGELLGQKLGIGTFAGGLLMGMILVVVAMFPIMMIARKRGSGILAEMVFGFGIFGLNVAFGWWPVWMIIILAFLTVLVFHKHLTEG